MRERCLTILLLLSMLPNAAGLSPDKVLCIGANHVGIESVCSECGQVTCRPTANASLAGGGQTCPRPALLSQTSCGRCTDYPGTCSSLSAAPSHRVFDYPLIQTAAPVNPSIIAGATVSELRTWRADIPAASPPSLFSSVLLI